MKVALFFGGKSVEHEISILTGLQIYKTLFLKHEVFPIYLDKENKMYNVKGHFNSSEYTSLDLKEKKEILVSKDEIGPYLYFKYKPKKRIYFDIVFLAVHGKGMEDGTLSSIFSYFNIPYVGPSPLSAQICQNKSLTKKILEYENINVISYLTINNSKLSDLEIKKVEIIGFPLILKANNLGSSIGIEVVNSFEELESALDYLFKYDYEVIIEKFIESKLEYNIAALIDNDEIILSSIEEVTPNEYLSFKDKYLSNENKVVGKKLKKSLLKEIEESAKKIVKILGCKYVVRIDYIYDLNQKKLYFNEINTIPGSYSNYLFKEKYTFIELLDKVLYNSYADFQKSIVKLSTVNNQEVLNKYDSFKLK